LTLRQQRGKKAKSIFPEHNLESAIVRSNTPLLKSLQQVIRKPSIAIACVIAASINPAIAAASPGQDALTQLREGDNVPNAVQNRFFLKEARFEIAPTLGYVPNNPFAKRYVGGVSFGYHFSEILGVEGSFNYSPDLLEGDLKGLTSTLVQIAKGSEDSFQQPLDKVTLAASFGITYAPIYGKINLLGERVVNFDLYGFLGIGMISKTNYNATYNEENPEQGVVKLIDLGNEVSPSPTFGLGGNFFINQTIALKLDTRFQTYVDNVPQYDINTSLDELEQRIYNNFVASVGVSVFFPQMKPRLYNF
jgi:outer membrane beta-barrel protein